MGEGLKRARAAARATRKPVKLGLNIESRVPVIEKDTRPSVMPQPLTMNVLNMTMGEIFDRDSTPESRADLDRMCGRDPQKTVWLGRFVLPPFQRPPVWTPDQNIRFLESVWNGLDIGRYVIINPASGLGPWTDTLIDGQQRIRAILKYVAGEFPVLGWYWPDLPRVDKRIFGNSRIFARAEIRENLTEAQIREMYNAMNYGGTQHTEDQRA